MKNIDAWLTVNAKIIPVGKMQHNTYASELLIDEMGLEGMMNYLEDNGKSNSYEILHKKGWVRIRYNCRDKIEILGNCVDLTKPMRNTIDPAMNTEQMRVAKRLCKDNGRTLQDAINDERFIK